LLETELFGHERGAFTGAIQNKSGLFEVADGGTVFLDEIGELPLSTQAKILRLLETGEIMKVGSVTPRHVDVRLISATHRDLSRHITEGLFRSDLYFRVNGITLTVPPLRERPDDLRPLADVFVKRALLRAKMTGRAVELLPPALAILEHHSWPGNVRELRNVIERAVLLARGAHIGPEHILLDAAPHPPSGSRAPASESTSPPPLRDQVEAFERERIREALQKSGGHQGKAAELLGIARRTLIEKLDAYGIERPRKR
jgi:DNA-binding NtrC family response regulator